MIEEGIENNGHAVVDVEIGVSGQLRRDDAARVRFVTDDPDVNGILVEQHANVGRLSRRPALRGFALRQRTNRWRRGPIWLCELSVKTNRSRGALRRRNPCIRLRTVRLLRECTAVGGGAHTDRHDDNIAYDALEPKVQVSEPRTPGARHSRPTRTFVSWQGLTHLAP